MSMLPPLIGVNVSKEITVGPDVFRVASDFDLGVGACYVKATLLAFDPDGETVGASSGEIVPDVYQIRHDEEQFISESSGQLGTFILDAQYGIAIPDGTPLPVLTHRMVGVCMGVIRVEINIIDGASFDPYAGANHPTATWRVNIERR